MKFKTYIRIFWVLVIAPMLFLGVLFFFISEGKMGFMPSIDSLANPKSILASEIYSSDQKLLGKYFNENRTAVDFHEISPHLINALIATEDVRFYEHSGVDGKALGRVAYGLFTFNQKGGGSTLTQQLAKMMFPRESFKKTSALGRIIKIAITKFKEWVIAFKLERNYTKNEIITMYLNKFDFLNLAVGVKSAARIYFNTTPDSLTIEQAAMLVGMVQNPSIYNPRRRKESTENRRNVVLSQMVKYNYLNPTEYDSLKQVPLTLDFQRVDHKKGISPYFREFLRVILNRPKPERSNYGRNSFRYIEDSIKWTTNPLYGWCNKNFKPDGTNYDLYQDGLKIYTTINSKMQQYAEESVREHLGIGSDEFPEHVPLQEEFEKELRKNTNAPFHSRISKSDREKIIKASVRRSERYRVLRSEGLNFDSIMSEFDKPIKMKVFSWKGEVDTVMTPIDSILYNKRFLRGGFMSMDPQTGYVKAYVGGTNFYHFKYDNVSLSKRQVGSTFKPFIYTLAMESGHYSPCYKIPNVPVSFKLPEGQDPPIYTPTFSTGSLLKAYEGKMITLKFGLSNSLNQVSAWIMKRYSPEAAIAIARKMGIISHIEPVFSLCTGAAEISLAEMVGAYGTFVNKGVFVEPIYVTRIEDKNGNIIAAFRPKKHEAISEETAYLMLNMLQGVVDNGTARRLRYRYKFENEIAGKTGTTNDNAVGWFIGITPNLVSGGWIGGEERSTRFENGLLGQGAHLALPIWAMYMKKVYADNSIGIVPETFKKPLTSLHVEIDCDVYQQEEAMQDSLQNIMHDGEEDDDDFF